MCKNDTLATTRMKIGIRTSSRAVGVWLYFTHLVNRVDYRHALPIFHITSTRLGGSRFVWSAQNMEPKATAGRPKPLNCAVVNAVMNGPTRRAACQTSLRLQRKFRCHRSFPQPSNANPVSYVTGTSGPMPTSKLQPLSQQGFWYLSSHLLA